MSSDRPEPVGCAMNYIDECDIETLYRDEWSGRDLCFEHAAWSYWERQVHGHYESGGHRDVGVKVECACRPLILEQPLEGLREKMCPYCVAGIDRLVNEQRAHRQGDKDAELLSAIVAVCTYGNGKGIDRFLEETEKLREDEEKGD